MTQVGRLLQRRLAKGETGESAGHDSGRKIVEILKANPDRKADQYSDKDVGHIRKAVAYW